MQDQKTASLVLAFSVGPGAKGGDAAAFCKAVDANAANVSDGIAAVLKKSGPVRVNPQGNRWVITFGSGAAEGDNAVLVATTDESRSQISFTANTADIAPIISALNAFFGNWRTVVGFIASAATVVGSVVVMQVTRRQ